MRVLIAEDETIIRLDLKELLERAGGSRRRGGFSTSGRSRS
jgi:hypothetical protein